MSINSDNGRFVSANGIRIHYHESGEGPPVVLLHGGGPGASGLSNYRRNIDALAKHFRVLVPDAPGFGQSENKIAPGAFFTPLADTLIAFMDALNISKASLVGNSMGGATALKAAVRHPRRIDRLVLMGPAGTGPVFAPMPTEGLMRMFGYYEGEGPTIEKLKRIIELLVYDRSSITEDLINQRFQASIRPDVVASPPLRGRGIHPDDEIWRDRLADLPHQTLLIWGREDRVVPLDAALIPLKAIPGARLHVFPKCGHWAQWEVADEFNSLVVNFLTHAAAG